MYVGDLNIAIDQKKKKGTISIGEATETGSFYLCICIRHRQNRLIATPLPLPLSPSCAREREKEREKKVKINKRHDFPISQKGKEGIIQVTAYMETISNVKW